PRDKIEVAVKSATLFDNLKQLGAGKRTTVSFFSQGCFPHSLSVSLWFIKTLTLSPYSSKTWRPPPSKSLTSLDREEGVGDTPNQKRLNPGHVCRWNRL